MPGDTVQRVLTASSEVVREINRRAILNLVRTRQPISRADLARLSNLQRSTVSLIVEELIEDNWIVEGATGRLPRGRRPTFLKLNPSRNIIGIDIRPTQISLALSDVNGRFSVQQTVPTPTHREQALTEIIERLLPLCETAGPSLEGIGISLPGRVDFDGGRLVFAPNLGWRDWDLVTPIAEATGVEVVIENAANACALASAWFDNISDCRSLVVVTVSEGIGTGIYIDGQLFRGLGGMAGEFGHITLDPSGPRCACGGQGCWEVFASNQAALRYYGQGYDLSFLDLLSRAEQGDVRAVLALDQMAHALGRGMRMVVAGLAPERISIVGDLTRAWHRFGPILESEVRAQVLPGGCVPPVVPIHEDGMARLRGTVALVLHKHFSTAVR